MLSGCACSIFVVFPMSLWACGFALGGGCGRQGTSGMHPRGFHYFIFILMVKRILLLALISLRTAAASRFFVGIRSGSHVVGRSGEKSHLVGVSLSVNPSVSVTGGGSVTLDRRGKQVKLIIWVSTLLSWVIISQVGIENPKVLVDGNMLLVL